MDFVVYYNDSSVCSFFGMILHIYSRFKMFYVHIRTFEQDVHVYNINFTILLVFVSFLSKWF